MTPQTQQVVVLPTVLRPLTRRLAIVLATLVIPYAQLVMVDTNTPNSTGHVFIDTSDTPRSTGCGLANAIETFLPTSRDFVDSNDTQTHQAMAP